MEIRVCSPSYRRPKGMNTPKYIPFVRVFVGYEEYEEYTHNNHGLTIIKCDKGVQGNLSRVRNFILRHEFNDGADVVCMVDDDMKGIYCWEADSGVQGRLLKANEILCFIEKYSIMAKDIGAYHWGVNLNSDIQVYREMAPFSTLSHVATGPFGCFLKGNNCWYDERFCIKEDYDMALQQLNKNRILLRINKFYYNVKQGKQVGGCAVQRNFEEEKREMALLQKKWGKKIVKWDVSDRSHGVKKVKKHIDRNPVIRVPIRGI